MVKRILMRDDKWSSWIVEDGNIFEKNELKYGKHEMW